jgi:Asp-tRNA(Asn)/Glu-tRNA(Gln) amidotransferase A subunit family amidase
MDTSIFSLGAAEIAQKIRAGEITPGQAVEAHIAQIERVNPQINALVTDTFESARREASRAAEMLAKKTADLPPLFGVPITVKDALPAAGVRFTAGSIHARGRIADQDAEAVRRMKAAGAIILGKTNCADMSGSTETNNLVFGLTRNPWNLDRSAGGSSGGEAAIIAARGSPLGLGSDIAGSIRLPAAFCGVFGLKPTGGRVSTAGHIPPTPESISDWNTVGPLARRTEDLALALSILSSTPTRDFRGISLHNRRVLVPNFLSLIPVSAEIAGAVYEAAKILAGCGLQVIRGANLPFLQTSLAYSTQMYRDWLPGYRRLFDSGRPIRLAAEIIANLRGSGKVSLSTLAVLTSVYILGAPLSLFGCGRPAQMASLRSQVRGQMGPGGLIIWPIFPTTAPRHGFAWNPMKSPAYTCILNYLGFPSVAVPMGISKANLPLSVQIIAGPGEDETALAAAAQLEQALGGSQMPPLIKNQNSQLPGLLPPA